MSLFLAFMALPVVVEVLGLNLFAQQTLSDK